MSKATENISLRDFGVEQVGCIQWGTHLSQFYESKQDLIDILVPYFESGLRNNEFCMWITSHPLEAEDAKKELERKVPDLDYFLRRGQIEIVSYDQWYLFNGKFDPSRVLKGWVEKEAATLKKGFKGLRLTGNTFWVERKQWQNFLNYEEKVNSIINQHRMIALCTYSLSNCKGSDVVDVILNHDGTLFKRENTWSLIEDVFHRRKIEQELIERQEKYHALFTNMIDGFAYHKIILNNEGKPIDYVFVEVNDAFERLTGLNRNNILGKRVTEVIPGIERETADWICTYGKVALTGKPTKFENYSAGLDRWYLVSAFSFEKGYFAATFEDITERKKAEEALQASEQRWATTLSSIGDAVISTNSSGNIMFMNSVAQDLTGWNVKDAHGKRLEKVFRIINEETRKKVESPVNQVLKEGRIVALANHTLLIRKDNSEIPIDDSGAPIKGKEGKITGVVLVFRDITEKKKTEQSLLENEKKERHRAEELNAILDAVPAAVWIASDSESRQIRGNRRSHELLRLPPNANASMSAPDGERPTNYRVLKDGKELKPQDMPVQMAAKGEVLRGYEFDIEFTDKTVRHLLGNASPLCSSDGKPRGSVAAFVDITERKKAEQELWQAKNDWERTFDTVPDFIAILDAQHRIMRANRAFAEQLGISPEEAIGKSCYSCVHGTSLPPEFCPHTKTLQDGKEHVAEIHESRLGGDFIVSTTPLKDEKGKIVGSVHVARDITDRKRSEDTLKKLNRHLRAISNSNQALLHAKNEQTYTQEVCDIIVNDCGYVLVWVGFAEHDEKKTVNPIAFAGDDEDYVNNLKVNWDEKSEHGRGPTGTAIRTGKPYVCKNVTKNANFAPWRNKALEKGYTASLVLPLVSNTYETFGALNIYSKEADSFTDEEIGLLSELANDFAYGITMLRIQKEKNQAEDKINKQAALIDLSPDAIIVRKLDGTISFWSRGAEKLYGWTKAETIRKNINSILQTEFITDSLEAIVSELKKKGNWSGELVHETKDGRKVTVQSYWLAKFDEKGEVIELMESNVDVTDRKQMQDKLEEYAAHLEELVQERTQQLKDTERLTAIGETAGMVGHDLRNPLQTVTGETYLAKEELQCLPESEAKNNLEENIQIISEQIGYMDKIVSDLQDFVRPIQPEKHQVNLGRLIETTLSEVSIPENIETSIRLQTDLPEISADAQLLKRVLFNLFNNGVQAMPKGGKLTVKAGEKKGIRENWIKIQVGDTGVGIPEQIKPKIFRPLFTTKSKGQGFGLAVCRRVIEAHGGSIRFLSKEGKGSQFIVELPLANNKG